MTAGTIETPDWSSIPAPQDDGAAAHLPGSKVPPVPLPATDGGTVDLSRLRGRTVVYAYPRTGRPGILNNGGWGGMPRVQVCLPQWLSFHVSMVQLRVMGVLIMLVITQVHHAVEAYGIS